MAAKNTNTKIDAAHAASTISVRSSRPLRMIARTSAAPIRPDSNPMITAPVANSHGFSSDARIIGAIGNASNSLIGVLLDIEDGPGR